MRIIPDSWSVYGIRMTKKNFPLPDAEPGLPSGEGRRAIPLDELDNPVLVAGLTYWRSLCKGRKFPSRSDITPRGLVPILRNTVLMRVIGGGTDYEFRVVGDASVSAHGMSVQGMLWSDLCKIKNAAAIQRKPLYDSVARSGEPRAFGGLIVPDNRQSELVHNTVLMMPLGPDDATVDHLLLVSVYAPNQ
jgi:hypothetical protein